MKPEQVSKEASLSIWLLVDKASARGEKKQTHEVDSTSRRKINMAAPLGLLWSAYSHWAPEAAGGASGQLEPVFYIDILKDFV